MKHNVKITIILMAIFILTQLIGLWCVNFYVNEAANNSNIKLPYGFNQSEAIKQTPNFTYQFLSSLLFSFVIAILIIFFLMKTKSNWIIKIWLFAVSVLSLGIFLNAVVFKLGFKYTEWIAFGLSLLIILLETIRKDALVHDFVWIFVYAGIASVFVSMLNVTGVIIVLILISIYDIWAVWKSKIMIKMAKYQMTQVGIFSGFLIPYADKKIREKIKLLKEKYKGNIPLNVAKKNKLRVQVAVLGGGDVVFPLIAAGVFLKVFGLIPALCVVLFSTLALLYLFMFGKKNKPYPAMPYLSVGIFIGMIIGWLVKILLIH